MGEQTGRPTVSVVIATRDREELLRGACAAVLAQDYTGDVEVLLVYDQTDPRPEHARDDPHRSVRVLTNTRVPGLAGARNTGIDAAAGELVAFCDDDDVWRPDKLTRQVEVMHRDGAIACVTGITVHYDGSAHDRVPEVDTLTVEALSRSRMTGAHPSSYLMDRAAVLDSVGMVDEDLPGGYGEDYDWLLRLAAVGRVSVVRAPLVDVLWHRGSYFSSRWASIIEALDYLTAKHPSVAADRRGMARILGQQSFAQAALGHRRLALRAGWAALRSNPAERRVYAALLVASGLVSADRIVHAANSRGRGI